MMANFGLILDTLFDMLLLFWLLLLLLLLLLLWLLLLLLLGCLVAWLLGCLLAWLLGCLVACPTSQGTVAGLAEGSWIYIYIYRSEMRVTNWL